MAKRGSVSVRDELYQRLVEHIGARKPGTRRRISRTVDKLINDYLDQQEQNRGN